MKSRIIKLVGILLIVMIMFTACGTSSATKQDSYPSKTITMVVPFAAGGLVDLCARGLAKYWGEELGVSMIVENRDGASTQVGTTYALQQEPDGHTIIFGSQIQLSSTIVQQNAPYKISDISMINFQQYDGVCVTVSRNSQFNTLEELIDYAKSNPGKLTCGIMAGGPQQLFEALMENGLGLKLKLVNYSSGNDLRTAILGSQVDFIVSNISGDAQMGDGVKILAYDGDKPFSVAPSVPLVNDIFKKYNMDPIPLLGAQRFLAVSTAFKDKYPDRYKKLVDSYAKVFNSDAYQKFLKESGQDVITDFYTPEESDKMNLSLHEVTLKYKDILSNK